MIPQIIVTVGKSIHIPSGKKNLKQFQNNDKGILRPFKYLITYLFLHDGDFLTVWNLISWKFFL